MRWILLHVVCVVCVVAQTSGGGWTYSKGGWSVNVSPEGRIERMRNGEGIDLAHLASQAFTLRLYDGDTVKDSYSLHSPISAKNVDSGVELEYDLSAECSLRIRRLIVPERVLGWPALRQTVTLYPTEPPFTGALELTIPLCSSRGGKPHIFVPRQDGVGMDIPFSNHLRASWPLTAKPFRDGDAGESLAIPMLSVSSKDNSDRVTFVADPYWSAGFHIGIEHLAFSSGYVITSDLPFHELTRTFWTVIHSGEPAEAIKAWYATALAEVPEGPDWLHDIAWQHYDYLSHGGQGWFEDLDAVDKYVAREDRGKVIFALHGWYDVLGRYTYDAEKGKLDDTWTAFPNAAAVKDRFPTSEMLPMTKAEMHRRIKYAKDRGVRVAIYFADGLTACEAAGRFSEDRLLSWGGWNGPDTVGKAYAQDPSNRDVYSWYLDYMKALLKEYGNEVDAFVWDETFMVRNGAVSSEKAETKQYIAPTFMRLVRDLTQMTTAYNSRLAFLTSDCIGGTSDDKTRWLDVPPYAIAAHGTYQDSHSRPSVWPYGIFPNYRNVLWSCNWSAVKNFEWTKFGVELYDTPVATSNGWLDDKGIARLTDEERQQVLDLFNARKTRQQHLKWLDSPAQH